MSPDEAEAIINLLAANRPLLIRRILDVDAGSRRLRPV